MAGTKAGAMKAKRTIQAKYGYDYYSKIGAIGGANGTTGGFASDLIGEDGLTGRERAKKAGVIGGTISRRGPAKKSMVRKVNDGENITKGVDE